MLKKLAIASILVSTLGLIGCGGWNNDCCWDDWGGPFFGGGFGPGFGPGFGFDGFDGGFCRDGRRDRDDHHRRDRDDHKRRDRDACGNPIPKERKERKCGNPCRFNPCEECICRPIPTPRCLPC